MEVIEKIIRGKKKFNKCKGWILMYKIFLLLLV